MARKRIILATAAAAATLILTQVATAQLDDHLWIGGTGNQLWQVDTNWSLGTFPNDPGRVDADPTVISNVEGANLSVNLAANLSVNVGATDVTVAALSIGSTSGAVTTNVTSSGGRLVFENFESNNTVPEPDVCAFNCGAALITSQGVAGATNTISAVVGINDDVQVAGTKDLTLSGGLAEIGTGESLSAMPLGRTVFITGNIITNDTGVEGGEDDTPLSLNSGTMNQGTIDVSGVISGSGRMRYGTPASSGVLLPQGTVIIRGNNTYSGRTLIGRGNVVLGHNNAFGTADVKEEGASGVGQTGYNISATDTRTIANNRIIGQWMTIKGEHSLTWNGIAYQDNTGGWINMLPAGETLTLGGAQYANHSEELGGFPLSGRFLSFDGIGKTLITGGLRDEYDDPENTEIGLQGALGNFTFQGTGTVVISGGNSTYTGITDIRGANVHFATDADYGSTSQIQSSAGAVGVDAGVASNSAFLGRLNNSSSPAADVAGNLVQYDHGGLMLATSEYGANLDFSSGSLANAGDMSLAAHEAGSVAGQTYTGSITPRNDTYRFGGGSGTLTLPGLGGGMTANQLTGARNVVATNGGGVNITNTNNYTGTTSIVAKYMESLEPVAAADGAPNSEIDDDIIPNDQRYVGTTLTVNTLANGGSVSNIGSSTNAASNLYIQGSTLKYVGPATSTDRLFTIGTGGATIDASGTGAVSFTNAAALGVDLAEARTGNVNAFADPANGAANLITIRNLTSTEDLQPGMPIMSPGLPTTGTSAGIPAGAVITRVSSRSDVTINMPVGTFAFHNNTPITFGPAPERQLTLAGTNTGNNTLASVIPNASDGGEVGVTKTGAGKWVATGNNTYTGDTSVEAGTLSITNAYLANTSNVRMTTGGIFDLNFVGTDVINGLLFNDATQAIGTWGAIGNLAATFQSAFFTGTGLLQVSALVETGLLGDYNNNGTVDAADYVVWRNNSGTTNPLLNDDIGGTIGSAHYDQWRANFGDTAGAGAGNGEALANTAVPEPTGVLLAVMALAGLAGFAQRGSRCSQIGRWVA